MWQMSRQHSWQQTTYRPTRFAQSSRAYRRPTAGQVTAAGLRFTAAVYRGRPDSVALKLATFLSALGEASAIVLLFAGAGWISVGVALGSAAFWGLSVLSAAATPPSSPKSMEEPGLLLGGSGWDLLGGRE